MNEEREQLKTKENPMAQTLCHKGIVELDSLPHAMLISNKLSNK